MGLSKRDSINTKRGGNLMGYKLFLDDVRTMTDCITYMHTRIGRKNPIYLERGWVICRNYGCFVETIKSMGLPDFISFDHDLAPEHYTADYQDWTLDPSLREVHEETGYECARWLIDFCVQRDLEIPDFAVHSMNPVGSERIFSLLTRAKRDLHDRERVQGIGD